MDNAQLRKISIMITVLVGNTVFMALLGPRRLFDNTYDTINSTFGYFIGEFIAKIGEGSYIIITYAVILFIAFKIFPAPKADVPEDNQE